MHISDDMVRAAILAFGRAQGDAFTAMRAALEAAEAAAWNKPADSLPKKPGKAEYEQIPCLIQHNGDVKISMWNCEHICWDDEYGDDYIAAPVEVKQWRLLPSPPSGE